MVYGKSVAERPIPARKRGSQTGFKQNPFHKRKVVFESSLEAKCLMVLMAHPDVHEVREQQKMPLIRFRGEDVLHYMDILVIWRSGRRSAFSVKYIADQTSEFLALIEAAVSNVGDRFANDYRTLSEADINRTQVWNAARILSAAKDHDYEAQQALIASLKTGPRHVRVGDCDAMLGDGVRGSRAAMALIKTGKLELPEGHRLSRDAILRNLFTN